MSFILSKLRKAGQKLLILFLSFENYFLCIYLTLQVNELRQELAARNLSSKGLKSQLAARLSKAIKSEQAKEEGRHDDIEENEKESSPTPKEDLKDDKKSKDSKEVNYKLKMLNGF